MTDSSSLPHARGKGFGDLSHADAIRVLQVQDEVSMCSACFAGIGPAVTVFGSARTGPGTKEYTLGVQIGALLAKAGYAVVTGGGPAAMEGANKGARSAGGLSIGVGIELPNEQQLNGHLSTGLVCKHLFVRKDTLIYPARAYVALPGGFGTLDELSDVLTLVQTAKVDGRPIVLVDREFWAGLIAWFKDMLVPRGMISREDLDLLQVVETPEEVVGIVTTHVASKHVA